MTFYRNVVWFIKGMREYTKSGFESAAKRFVATDLDVDCSGKSFMITGANSGLGKQAAIEIAKRGGKIHMVCRNPTYAEEAKKEILEVAKTSDSIHIHILDMSDPKAVYKFAREFDQPLTVLINNAGCMVNTRTETPDGFEKNFATNTLGTHILTETLIPHLQKSSDKARVVIVSSGGMLTHKLDLTDMQSEKMNTFDGTMAYAQNKRQQVIMTEQYAAKYPEIFFASMHPGWADTPAVQSSMPDFHAKMKDKLRSVEQGADTIVWLAIAEKPLNCENGTFFQDRQSVSTHLPLARTRSTPEECKELMVKLDEYNKRFTV